LAKDLDGASCLDLFAGTGALGLEALSRGAKRCDFVETRPASLHALKANIAALRMKERTRVFKKDAIPFAAALDEGAYDLVFVNEDATTFEQLLEEALRLTRNGGYIVFEHALRHNRVADLSQRDSHTVATRQFLERVREDEALMPVLLPVGDGLMVAIKDGGLARD
jgi:16S rRNA (guanine(966)-N(2))-methyltransferase RsmD